MPLITTAPGAAGVGPKPFEMDAVYAANSATSLETPATPMPPTTTPLSKIGTPPGLTAVGSLSYRSALPVAMPRLGEMPSSAVGGAIDWPVRKFDESAQPRLLFSIA